MLREVNEAKEFLAKKFGDLNSVPAGTYAVPTQTSKGPAFMRVEILPNMGMKDFGLWWDEAFTQSWHQPKPEPGTKVFNNQQDVAACLPPEVAEKYLANFDQEKADKYSVFPCTDLLMPIKFSIHWEKSPEGREYWMAIQDRVIAGEFNQ